MLLRSGRSKDNLPGGSRSRGVSRRRCVRSRPKAAAEGATAAERVGRESQGRDPGPARIYPDLAEVRDCEAEAENAVQRGGALRAGESVALPSQTHPLAPLSEMENWGSFSGGWWNPMANEAGRSEGPSAEAGGKRLEHVELGDLEERRARQERAARLASGAALLEQRQRNADAEAARRRRRWFSVLLDVCGRAWKMSQSKWCCWIFVPIMLVTMFLFGLWAGKQIQLVGAHILDCSRLV